MIVVVRTAVGEDGGGEDDSGSERIVEEGVLETAHREERKDRCVVDLQQWSCFKVEKSKMPMVHVLCQKKCVQLSFLITKTNL